MLLVVARRRRLIPVADPDAGRFGFVIVASGALVAASTSIALVTHFREAVATNVGLSLAGSRCGDRRVCALWISKGAPKLGWCWAGNPHTWLGIASCAGRAGTGQD